MLAKLSFLGSGRVAILTLLAVFVLGCGSSNQDFITTTNTGANTGANTGGTTGDATGSLSFSFTQTQSAEVPTATITLNFEFFDATGNSVLVVNDVAFAPTITIENVPTSATDVEITAFDVVGEPLVAIAQAVDVVPNTESTVNFDTATIIPVRIVSLSVSPNSADLAVDDTVTLQVSGSYSNGIVRALPASAITFNSSAPSIATVSTAGVVTGVSAGGAEISADIPAAGIEPAITAVNVSEIAILFQDANTQNLVVDEGGNGSSGNYGVFLFDSTDAQSQLLFSNTGLSFAVTPATTGVSVVSGTNGNFRLLAQNANLGANDVLTVTATFVDGNGITLTATRDITVTVINNNANQ